MNYYKYINEYKGSKNLAIALGKFDGLHKGHQELIDHITQLDNANLETMVIAFSMEAYFQSHSIQYQVLSTVEEKYEKLQEEYGVLLDHVVMCPFTEEIAQMEGEEFVKKILVDKLKCKYLVVGTDFRFGKGASGDTWKLKQLGEVYDFHVEILEKARYKEEEISSTYVKSVVQKGAVEEAEELLGAAYSITNIVIHGAKLGRTIGFPTLNLAIPEGKVMPPRGVYACRIFIEERIYYGVGNIGRKPTVSDVPVDLLEVHVFDFNGDVYGQKVKVELLKFYRPEQKFQSLEELIKQLHLDAQMVKVTCNLA